ARLDRSARVVEPPARHPEGLDRLGALLPLDGRPEERVRAFPVTRPQREPARGKRVCNREFGVGTHAIGSLARTILPDRPARKPAAEVPAPRCAMVGAWRLPISRVGPA